MQKSTNPNFYQENLVQKDDYSVETFCKNVIYCKEASGYTWQEIADITGISLDVLKRISMFKGDDFKISTLIKLSQFFQVSADELSGGLTLSAPTIKSLQTLRKLDPSYREFFRSVIQWIHDYLSSKNIKHKAVPCMYPECAGGSNSMIYRVRNIREPIDISDLPPEIRVKIIQAVKIPCNHYVPRYFKDDILLIAKDRVPNPEDIVVVLNDGCFGFAHLKVEISEGKRVENLYSIIDGSFRSRIDHVDQILGYVAYVLTNGVGYEII